MKCNTDQIYPTINWSKLQSSFTLCNERLHTKIILQNCTETIQKCMPQLNDGIVKKGLFYLYFIKLLGKIPPSPNSYVKHGSRLTPIPWGPDGPLIPGVPLIPGGPDGPGSP